MLPCVLTGDASQESGRAQSNRAAVIGRGPWMDLDAVQVDAFRAEPLLEVSLAHGQIQPAQAPPFKVLQRQRHQYDAWRIAPLANVERRRAPVQNIAMNKAGVTRH